jgi:hypothetical protein
LLSSARRYSTARRVARHRPHRPLEADRHGHHRHPLLRAVPAARRIPGRAWPAARCHSVELHSSPRKPSRAIGRTFDSSGCFLAVAQWRSTLKSMTWKSWLSTLSGWSGRIRTVSDTQRRPGRSPAGDQAVPAHGVVRTAALRDEAAPRRPRRPRRNAPWRCGWSTDTRTLTRHEDHAGAVAQAMSLPVATQRVVGVAAARRTELQPPVAGSDLRPCNSCGVRLHATALTCPACGRGLPTPGSFGVVLFCAVMWGSCSPSCSGTTSGSSSRAGTHMAVGAAHRPHYAAGIAPSLRCPP